MWKPSACILCECNCGIEILVGADGRSFDKIRGEFIDIRSVSLERAKGDLGEFLRCVGFEKLSTAVDDVDR